MLRIIGKFACATFLLLASMSYASSLKLVCTTLEDAPLIQAGIGQPFLVHVIATDVTNTTQYPTIVGVENFYIRNSGFQMNMVNGTTSVTYHYQMRINTAGTYTIGPAQLNQNGTLLESAPLTITVGAQQQTNVQGTNNGPQDTFLTLTTNKQRAVIGEKVHAILTFYTTDPAVVIEQLIEPDQKSITEYTIKNAQGPFDGTEKVNGTAYRFARWEFDLYPRTAGTIVIPVYTAIYNNKSRRDMISLFFSRNASKKTHSKPISMAVDPIPSGAQSVDFVGRISNVAATVNPHEARVGDGILYTLSITGEGDFDAFKTPPLKNLSPDLKWYESQRKVEPSLDDPHAQTLRVEYIIQALKPGTLKIPSQELHFFDTHDRMLRTRKTPELSLKIHPAAAAATVQLPAQTALAPSAAITQPDPDGLMPLSQSGPWIPDTRWLIPWHWFWALVIAFLLGWFLLIFMRTHTTLVTRALIFWQQKNIYKMARAQITQAAEKNQHSAFYAIFVQLLAARAHIKPGELNPSIIDRMLLDAGLSMAGLKDWHIFYDKLAAMVFAVGTVSRAEQEELKEQSLYWIDVFEKLPQENEQ